MKKTSIGGSALIEGLMMIGPENAAIAVRKPDGEIIVEKRPLPISDNLTKIWLIRGVVNFFRQMILVYKALMFSASFVDLEEEESEEKKVKKVKKEKKPKKEGKDDKKKDDAYIYIAVLISLGFSVLLFMILPNIITGFANNLIFHADKGAVTWNQIALHLFEGFLRILIFLIYIIFASRLNDIKRVWQYHGAEHKTIHCYEHGEALTVENVRKYTTRHPRCGTSFLIIVMVLSIIIFSLTGWWGMWMNILIRLVMIPVIAGLSYEILRFAGRSENKYVKLLNKPGEWFQAFTTKEPDDSMLEVAIAAMENVLVEDERADEW